MLTEIAAALMSLSFSRADEAEADADSVHQLCATEYNAAGAAGFFEKLEGMEIPEFLSTHPSSSTRVEDINNLAVELGCDTDNNPDVDYQAIINSLP